MSTVNLNHFRDVHPNWHLIKNLDNKRAVAALDLLITASVLDGKIGESERTTLIQEWRQLPFVGDGTDIDERVEETWLRVGRFYDEPDGFQDWLANRCSRFESSDEKFAVMRLVAINTMYGGLTERELDFLYNLGDEFGFDFATVDQVIRSVWEAYQRNVDEAAGLEHHIPTVGGAKWATDRSKKRQQNPFTQAQIRSTF